MSKEKSSSHLPDLKEITGMAKKFFGDVCASAQAIYKDYQAKKCSQETPEQASEASTEEEKNKSSND